MPVAGLSQTTGDVDGLNHVTGVLTPVGGYHQIEGRVRRFGLTAGIDLAKTSTRGLSIMVPIRVTRMSGERPDYWPAMFDIQAGVGISVPVMHRIGLH
jgi:hypothetical protein